jgi:hypothetical protein
MPDIVFILVLQAGQTFGGALGHEAASTALMPAPQLEPMSDQEAAAWLLDLAGTCSLAQLSARGIPTKIDRWDHCLREVQAGWMEQDEQHDRCSIVPDRVNV